MNKFCIRCTANVEFVKQLPPAGIEMLSALAWAAQTLQTDLWITSAAEGDHSGPEDPHKLGNAYDIRTHGLSDTQKDQLLQIIMEELTETTPVVKDGGLVTAKFFGWIEDRGGPNEHAHVQLRKGETFP